MCCRVLPDLRYSYVAHSVYDYTGLDAGAGAAPRGDASVLA